MPTGQYCNNGNIIDMLSAQWETCTQTDTALAKNHNVLAWKMIDLIQFVCYESHCCKMFFNEEMINYVSSKRVRSNYAHWSLIFCHGVLQYDDHDHATNTVYHTMRENMLKWLYSGSLSHYDLNVILKVQQSTTFILLTYNNMTKKKSV